MCFTLSKRVIPMSKTIPSKFEDVSANIIERCSSCTELMQENEIDPNYDGPLATYANNTYCTLKCMEELPTDSGYIRHSES